MKQWQEELCQQQPDELELVAPDTYIQRRNIEEVAHEETEDTPAYTSYKCESREISASEYAMLNSIEEIDTQKAIDDYTEQLVEEGLL